MLKCTLMLCLCNNTLICFDVILLLLPQPYTILTTSTVCIYMYIHNIIIHRYDWVNNCCRTNMIPVFTQVDPAATETTTTNRKSIKNWYMTIFSVYHSELTPLIFRSERISNLNGDFWDHLCGLRSAPHITYYTYKRSPMYERIPVIEP